MMASHRILIGDVLDKLAELPEKSVHCCATSPPYWGLRDYKVDGQIGLEPTIDEYVAKMVEVFGDSGVRRVLRDDGTLWVNLGDSYANDGKWGGETGGKQAYLPDNDRKRVGREKRRTGLKPLDLCNVPHRVASALQADGWYWRSTIIWAKGLSFCDEYAGSVMPESLSGLRWERCRAKVGGGKRHNASASGVNGQAPQSMMLSRTGRDDPDSNATQWSDCPGCPKCKPNGGYVLRKGSWRPTSAYEFVFQFAKTADYFCDGEAVREAAEYGYSTTVGDGHISAGGIRGSRTVTPGDGGSRNLRNVWVINPQPFPDAHFATFPEKLVEPIIKAATSDKGVCPECGAPWARVIESTSLKRERPNDRTSRHNAGDGVNSCGNTVAGVDVRTLGWRPTCLHRLREPYEPGKGLNYAVVPATVLDPFVGSGTTLLVARKLGRDSIGIELNPDYAAMAEARVGSYAPLFAAGEPAA